MLDFESSLLWYVLYANKFNNEVTRGQKVEKKFDLAQNIVYR